MTMTDKEIYNCFNDTKTTMLEKNEQCKKCDNRERCNELYKINLLFFT